MMYWRTRKVGLWEKWKGNWRLYGGGNNVASGVFVAFVCEDFLFFFFFFLFFFRF